MDLSTFYKWIGVTSTKLADANPGTKQAAQNAWLNLSQWTILFVLFSLISFLMVIYYYTLYNNQPGRHYTPAKWGLVGILSLIMVFVITFVSAFIIQKPNGLSGIIPLELRLSLGNTLIGLGFYFFVSLAWCNIKELPTNAYRFLKI